MREPRLVEEGAPVAHNGGMDWKKIIAFLAVLAHVVVLAGIPARVEAAPSTGAFTTSMPCHDEGTAKAPTHDPFACCVPVCCMAAAGPEAVVNLTMPEPVLAASHPSVMTSVCVDPGDRPPRA